MATPTTTARNPELSTKQKRAIHKQMSRKVKEYKNKYMQARKEMDIAYLTMCQTIEYMVIGDYSQETKAPKKEH